MLPQRVAPVTLLPKQVARVALPGPGAARLGGLASPQQAAPVELLACARRLWRLGKEKGREHLAVTLVASRRSVVVAGICVRSARSYA